MNKKEKIEYLNNLKANPRISNLQFDSGILKRGRDDSIWYSESVLYFLLDNRYFVSVEALGDVRITHIPSETDVVSKGYGYRDVVEFLENLGLTTDKKVQKAESKGDLYFENNNWFEEIIIDEETNAYIDDYCDISDGPFNIDLASIDERIKIYEEDL